MAVVRAKGKEEEDKVEAGMDASKIKKSFSARKNLIGQVVFVDEDTAKFEFRKEV